MNKLKAPEVPGIPGRTRRAIKALVSPTDPQAAKDVTIRWLQTSMGCSYERAKALVG